MQLLCTLRNHCRQWPRNTRYQAGAAPYLGRTSTGRIAPACLAHSLDHLVGECQQLVRDVDAEHASGSEIYHQFKFGRLLDWQVVRFGALENFPDIMGRYLTKYAPTDTIAHQTAAKDESRKRINRWYAVASGQCQNLMASLGRPGSSTNDERACPTLHKRVKGD